MTKYIAIDGAGGAGKTHLSKLLAKRLNAPVFHLDDFGGDYHPFIGIPAMVDAVKSLDRDVVILEGIGVFDERFDFLLSFRIFVDTPEKIRNSRAAGRDVPSETRSASDWEEIYQIWENESTEYIKNALNRAELVVRDSDEEVVDMIVEQTRSFLEPTH